MKKSLVLKFGGASVKTPQCFASIAEIILRRKKRHPRVLVVVSAMGDSTNRLLALAKEVNPSPPQRELDMLVSVGERISISLLAMALAKKGQRAVSFTGSQSGIITTDAHTDARILEVRPHRLETAMDRGDVVIVAGFQGVSRHCEITTLGRGGSDTSAVALAVALSGERVEFYKDVPGVFDSDPKENPQARHLAHLSFDEALTIANKGASILHPRCLYLAAANGIPLHVLSFLSAQEEGQVSTLIGESAIRRTQIIYEEETITEKALVTKSDILVSQT